MRSMTRPAASVAVAALVLAACGGTDGATTADDATTDPPAAETTAESSPTTATTSEEASADATEAEAPEGDGQQVLADVIAASGGDLTARTRVTSVSQTPEGEVEIVAEGVQDGANSRMTMTTSGLEGVGGAAASLEMEVVLLDGTMYQRSELLTSQLGTDKQWLAFDTTSLGPEFESMLDTAEAGDPADQLEAFREAGSVEVVGEEEVNGVQTTHLVVEVPLRAALEAQGMDGSSLDGSGVDADEPVAYDLWVDGDDRLRRMQVELEVDGMTSATTVDVLEYGVDVEIEAPPADQVVSFDELMQQLGGGGGTG